MDQGISIPISGDLAGLYAATREVTQAIRNLAQQIQAAMGPARATSRQVAVAMNAVGTGARGSTSSVKSLIGTISNTGAVLANVVAGAQAARTAFRAFQAVSSSGGVAAAMVRAKGALSGVTAGMRELMANPALRKIAIAAVAAGVAIGGVVAAVKLARAAMGLLATASRAVFSGILAGARAAGNALSSLGSKLRGVLPGGGGGGGLLGPLLGIAGVAGSVALVTSQLKDGLSLAADMERTGIAMEALTGSAAGSNRVMDEMRATWLRTGATVADQAATIQKFLALGFNSEDAIRLQRNILDVAGAVGMSSSEAALLGSALAQVKAKGVVSMEELRQQIAEKGVPVFEALASKLGVTQGALMKLVEDGKVPAQQFLDIFLNMEGPLARFGGGAARMGATFGGLISRLRGAWNLLRAEFAAPIADAVKPMLAGALGMLQNLRARAAELGAAVGNVIASSFALVKTGKTFELLRAGFAFAISGAVDLLMRGLRGAIAFLATALPPIFSAATAKLRDPLMWEGIKAFFDGVASRLAAATAFSADVRQANENAAEAAFAAAKGLMGAAGKTDFGDAISNALVDATQAAAAAMGGPASAGFGEAKDALKSLLESVREEVARMRASVAVPPPAKPAAAASKTAADATAAGRMRELLVLTSSLTRVGGSRFGMSFSPMITEQKRSNSLLRNIERNTRGAGRVPAIV